MTARQDVSMKGWPGNLVACVEVIAAALARKGRETAEANGDARAVTMALADYFGGRQFYMPSGAKLRALARQEDIIEAVNRTGNVQQVARDFGMSAARVYQIVNAAIVARREAKP